MRSHVLYTTLLALAVSPLAHALRVDNGRELRATYRMNMYPERAEWTRSIKVAILDNGFGGFDPRVAGILPDTAELIEGPKNPFSPTNHGLGMAVMAWTMTARDPAGPKFYLVNANGYTNFKAAVDFVVNNKVDIVVYSQTWLYGSNFDGTGLFEAQLKRAADAGAIWLGAVGNYRGLVYSRNVLPLNPSTGYVPLPEAHDTLEFESRVDDNPITVAVSWNDFGTDETYATKKDLDVFVYDELGTLVGSGELKQTGVVPPSGDTTSTLSALARESVSLRLKRGRYRIKIKANGSNFDSRDRFRVVIAPGGAPDSVRLFNNTGDDEVTAPADSSYAITVGDCSAVSSSGAEGVKPDVVLPDALVQLSTGQPTVGSSNATALLGGILAVLKAQELNLSATNVRQYLVSLRPDSRGENACRTHAVWRTPSPDELRSLVRGR